MAFATKPEDLNSVPRDMDTRTQTSDVVKMLMNKPKARELALSKSSCLTSLIACVRALEPTQKARCGGAHL